MNINIKLNKKYKSLNIPCDFELPAFCVLTGKNGSGKTHLLEAMSVKGISQVSIDGRITENVRYIGFNGLNPSIQEICDPATISQYIKNVWNNFNNARKTAANRSIGSVDDILRHLGDENMKKLILKSITDSKKTFNELSEDDIADSFDISFMGQNDFFTAQFALIFKNYHKRQEENNINWYYKEKGHLSSKIIYTNEEFIGKFGEPPWDFVNKILEKTNIPYEVNNPIGDRLDSSFIFKLRDRIHGFEISSADLSTGEKVLMSLALAIYNSKGDSGKPDILLIDEPDAGLHPSMSKMMVSVLKENIVEQNKIPTVITTHSPTTVISCEGVAIYQLVRGKSIPVKTPIQQAVEILSSDIPFLKISTDKRRQVFVESKYDVTFYELLMNIYGRLVKYNAEPVFIPVRTSNGSNCSDVVEIVNNLFLNGNEQIFGIIDWDLCNKSTDRLFVLGEGERYAIENYLLDPLLMGILCIRENKIPISDFNGLSFLSYSQINTIKISDAQKIIDKVLKDLNLNSSNIVIYNIFNGWQLQTTKEFNEIQGHALEALYKKTYPFLNVYQREDALKKDIIEKVINDHPLLAPKSLCKVLMKFI
jgi:energy-coupling factor transporter ATP-binding protein EcfA2